jgi:glycosyltransferase involved in cell wall biosynthesis
MRLLLVSNRYPANGADRASPFMPDFVAALVRAGAEVRVVTPDYGTRPNEEAVPVRRFPGTRDGRVVGQLRLWWPPDILDLAGVLRRWRKAVEDEARGMRPEALLACWALPSGWIARSVAAECRAPYGVWCLGSDILVWGAHPAGRAWVVPVLRGAARRWADGLELAERASRLAGGPCCFLPSWHELPAPQFVAIEDPHEAPIVLTVSRLEASKGTLTFLAAAERLLKEEPALRIHIVGWGTLEEGVARWARDPARKGRARFWGQQPPGAVHTLLRRCACLVIPTTLDSIPLVFGEAVQAGAPLVVSDYGDLPRLVRDYGLGAAFRSGDARDLARAALEIVRHGSGGASAAGRARLQAEFSPDRAARQVLAGLAAARTHD